MTIFFTADTHFGHTNILKYSAKTRPYADVNAMNRALIEAWNSVVTDKDEVWHLGDAFFKIKPFEIKSIWDQLRGRKHLIYGNHDHSETRKLPWASQSFGKYLRVNGYDLHLSHHPVVFGQWNKANHGGMHLYGHVHGETMYTVPCRVLDVGVDNVGFTPISFDEVIRRLEKNPATKVHHNGERP